MSIRIKQVLTGVLALTGIDVGVWAAAWPRQFYDSFPGLGRHWILALGPYNEHLVRDVGGLYLAMAIISMWAVVRPRTETFAMVGLGWLGFNILHFVYHMRMLHMYTDSIDKVGNVVTLAALLICAALLLLPSRRHAIHVGSTERHSSHAHRSSRRHRLDRQADRQRPSGPR